MAAGDGAQQEARRHAARAEAAERSWTAGAEGERAVAALLASLPPGQVALHDLPWPGRPRANLDHVVVGPRSVVVVDAKSWSGDVAVRAGTLWQDGRRRTQSLDGVVRAVAAVATLLAPAHRASVRGVVCLTGSGRALPPAELDGVLVTGSDHLLEALASLQTGRITPAEVPAVAAALQSARPPVPRPTVTTAPAASPGPAARQPAGAAPGRGGRAATGTRPARRRARELTSRDLPGLVFVLVVGGAVLVGGVDGLQSLTQPVVDALFRAPTVP